MGKYADFILLQFISFLAALMICSRAGADFTLSLVIAFLVMLTVGACGNIIASRRKKDGRSGCSDYRMWCRLQGDEGFAQEVARVMSVNGECTCDGNIVYTPNGIIAVYGRFSPLSADAVAALYRKCKSKAVNEIHILSTCKEIKTVSVTSRLDITFHLTSFRKFYRFADKTSMLPCREPVKINRLNTVKSALPLIFGRANARRFVFTAFVLTLTGFITPMRTYYFTVAGIALLLAVICIFNANRDDGKNNDIFSLPPSVH